MFVSMYICMYVADIRETQCCLLPHKLTAGFAAAYVAMGRMNITETEAPWCCCHEQLQCD